MRNVETKIYKYSELSPEARDVARQRDGKEHIGELMQAAFRNWLRACQADCSAQYEDGNLSETFDANGIEFYEDGEMYS